MVAGSVTFSTELDNADLEMELGRLKKKILRQMDDMGRIKFKKNDLEEQLKAANEALDKLDKRGKTVGEKIVYDPGDIEKILKLRESISKMEAEIQKCDEAVRNSNRDLEYTKLHYGEILQEAERLRDVDQSQPSKADTDLQLGKMSENVLQAKQRLEELIEEYQTLRVKQSEGSSEDVSAQMTDNLRQAAEQIEYINGLAKDDILGNLASGAEVAEYCIAQIQQRLTELNEQRQNSDSMPESEIARLDERIAAFQEILAVYQRNLDAAYSNLGINPELKKMAEDAQAANDRITELQERLTELQGQRSHILLPTPGNYEYFKDLTKQIEALEQESISCEKYLDGLAENDSLGQLAGGAEIAEQRMEDLAKYLEGLQGQKIWLNLTFGSNDKKAELQSEIAEVERLLEAYRRNLDAAGASGGIQNIADDADIANQHIVELNQELLDLEQRKKELSEAGQGLGYQEYDQLIAKIAEVKRELSDYEKTLTESSKGPEDQVNRTSKAMGELGSILGKVKELLSPKDSEISSQLLQVIETIAPKLTGKIVPAIEAVSTAVGGIVAKLTPVLAVLGLVLTVLKKVAKEAIRLAQQFASAIKTAVTGLWKAGGTMAGWLSKGMDSAKKFGNVAVSVFSEVAKRFSKLMSELNVFPKLADAIGSKLKRLGQMIRRVFVFSVITSGLRALRSQVSAYLNLNEQFSTALRRLQGVLLTAFQPIYDVIVPALTTLIQVLSQAIAVVVQFFSALFGTTAKKAQASAKALYGQAQALQETGKAAKEAGDAAEEAAGSLAAFDEINMITIETDKKDSSSSGGGGGGGGADTGPLFDWDYSDETFGSWGEAFSAFLDKLLDGLPKLEEAFKKFADWLNGLAQKLYDMFTFPGVLDKVKALGKGLAEALNKLVNWIDWKLLGKALGAGLNLALNFLTSFLYAFDWMNLGRKLAEFVNGLVEEIDWYEFGRLLWAGFKIALETLAGFILGLDMPLLARAASDTIKGFFDEMYNTIARINWQEIGRQIARFLNNIDWYGCITSALTAIQAAIVALAAMVMGFVDELSWSSIARKIYTAINDSLNQVDWRNIGMVIGNAFKAIFDFVRELVAGIHWHQIGENIADFILGFDFVGALSSLAMLIAEGINAAVQLACGFLDRVEPELKSIAEGIANGLKEAIEAVDWKKFGEVVSRAIKGALTFVAGLLDPSLFYSIGKAIGDFFVNLDWVGIVGGLAKVLANAINSAVAAVKGFLDSVQPNLKAIADGIAAKINQFFDDVDWVELGKTISRGIEAALDFLLELIQQLDWDEIGRSIADLLANIDWDTLLEKWGQVMGEALSAKMKLIDISDIVEIGKNLVKGLKMGWLEEWEHGGGFLGWLKRNAFDKMFSKIKEFCGIASPSKVMAEIGRYLVAGLLQGISETWSGILEFFKEKVDAIIEFFSGAWDSIKEKTSSAWETIKTTLGGIWDGIKKQAAEIFEAVIKTVQDAWESVKKATSDVWKDVKKALEDAWKAIKDAAKEAFEFIKKTITDIWDNIKSKTTEIWNNVKTFLSTLWDNLKTTVKTVFENIKTTISNIWENIKSKTTEIWNNIKTTLTTLWNNLKTTVTNTFNEIKNKIVEVWTTIKNEAVAKWNEIKTAISNRINEIKTAVSTKFAEIKTNISQAWESVRTATSNIWSGIKSTVSGALSEIAGKVSSTFSNIVSSAKSWGSDIASNISSGINGAVSKVKNAVTGLADKINRNLHFSEPDEGPLKDFHTYMPDMLQLMAKGIRDNTHLAVSAASDLAGSIANTVSGKSIGVNMDMPDISKFSIPMIAQGAVIPANREFSMIMQREDGSSQEQDILTRQTFRSEMTRTTNLLHSILSAIEKGKVIKIDSQKFGRAAIASINDVNMTSGKQGLMI